MTQISHTPCSRLFSTTIRVECPVPVHDARSRSLFHKKCSCVRSRSVRNLYDGLKLEEQSTATLLKDKLTIQIKS